MNRVMVIGCCGAGKTTFARHLNKITKIPVIHLDREYWKQNWIRPEQNEWHEKIQELCHLPCWIMDGNYNSTIKLRAKYADTIIFLDYSTTRCLLRVINRMILQYGKNRYDLPNGCQERFDLDFLKYVATYRYRMRNRVLEELHNVNDDTDVIIFNNDSEADIFLSQLKNKS